ncbi:hypothetical protein AAF712_011567 [Marasmius tenuissimus]|uniref:Uncharacterized protein n=1 Tax=Marasmius tenuissimus TaxID=585030 RepID=A0ABR2ZJP4_9AGAR
MAHTEERGMCVLYSSYGLREYSRDDTPVRPTRLETQGKAVVASRTRTRPKIVEQESLGTKAAGVNVEKTPATARG